MSKTATRTKNNKDSRAGASAPAKAVSLAISGSGGAGVITVGDMVLRLAADAGWYGLMTRSTGPQIRGGEAAALVTLSAAPVAFHKERFDLLLAVDWMNTDRFAAEIALTPDSIVIGDSAVADDAPPFVGESAAKRHDVPLKALADETEGGRVNMIAIGVLTALLDLPWDALRTVIKEKIGAKGDAAVASSEACAEAGFHAVDTLKGKLAVAETGAERDARWMISGNEAAGLGAVRGGVRFAAAYPITPATEILEWLAPALAKVGGTLVQAEDELASINMIVGASYGGVPAVTATSGPGFALMIESIGLATASEVPVVVIDVMRGGPSTGIPTKSEQSDLNMALYGLHGDAPHIVVAPQSIADCVFTTQWAVHLAEAMQVPAIVLSDQFLGQARAVIDRPADVSFFAKRRVETEPETGYHRYAVTADGVSPMALPGTKGGQYTADGLEHTPRGTPSSRAEDHLAQLDKRRRKVEEFDYGEHWASADGDGKIALVTWGSTAGPVHEAVRRAREEGFEIRTIVPRLLAPARPEAMAELLDGVETTIVVEQTDGAQFYRYLRAYYDLPGRVHSLHRPGPLTIQPSDVLQAIKEWGQA